MSREQSPYTRGFEAGFKAGWHARDVKATEALAEMVLLVKPTDIEAAERRIEKRAQRPAGDDRPDFPGKAVMNALAIHEIKQHGGPFDVCGFDPCGGYFAQQCLDAIAWEEWSARQ